MDDADEAAIRALEARRCQVVNDDDIDRLGGLLAEDYLHIHANGLAEGRDDAVTGFRKMPRSMTRGDLAVRLYGDIAVMTGPQFNVLRPVNHDVIPLTLMVTQVMRKSGDGWRFVSFHGCVIPA